MIVKSTTFLSNASGYIGKRFFLFYGPNFGKVEDCSNSVVKIIKEKDEKYSIVNVSLEEFAKEGFYGIIKKYDAVDIFGKKNILMFSSIEIKSMKGLHNILQDHKFDSLFVIFKFHNLTKRSEIRTFFEKNNDSICVPCYEETILEKKNTIIEFFKKENLAIDKNEVENLSAKLTNQKLEILFELEKIVIFLKYKKKSLGEFLNNLEKTIFSDDSELIFELVSGEKNKFSELFFNSSEFKNNEIKIINSLTDHFSKLLLVKNRLGQGVSLEEALKSLKPPIFFKYIERFKMQVGLWKENEINEVLKQLYICQRNFFDGLKSAKYKFLFLVLRILNKGSR